MSEESDSTDTKTIEFTTTVSSESYVCASGCRQTSTIGMMDICEAAGPRSARFKGAQIDYICSILSNHIYLRNPGPVCNVLESCEEILSCGAVITRRLDLNEYRTSDIYYDSSDSCRSTSVGIIPTQEGLLPQVIYEEPE